MWGRGGVCSKKLHLYSKEKQNEKNQSKAIVGGAGCWREWNQVKKKQIHP